MPDLPDCLCIYGISEQASEARTTAVLHSGPEAGQEIFLYLVGQGLPLVRDTVGVQDGDEDHGDDPLNVPQQVLAGRALDHPGHDVSLINSR